VPQILKGSNDEFIKFDDDITIDAKYDASSDVIIISDGPVQVTPGIKLSNSTPSPTTDALYNNSGFLKFNGDNVPLSTDTTVKDIRVMTLAAYGSLSPKDPNTLYFVY
jgi:hypothetical protein